MSVQQDTQLAGLFLQREVEALYTLEAELLDERRFTEWLELFADDARYWMPIPRNVPFDRPETEYTRERTDANWFDEGKDDLSKRVQQILGGDHWAEEPRSRTTHLTSNVGITTEADGTLNRAVSSSSRRAVRNTKSPISSASASTSCAAPIRCKSRTARSTSTRACCLRRV